MSQEKTGGAAFPTKTGEVNGMTLLDYFAAKAMQGIMSFDPKYADPATKSQYAYNLAAAMLEARKNYIP